MGHQKNLAQDGGPQFTLTEFQSFSEDWGAHCQTSSAGHPQSNRCTEFAVKASKRIIMNFTTDNGDLNNSKAARAIL